MLPMPRRTSRYALDTFLRQLARTGNFALAADLAGLAKSGLYKRRARDRAFEEACETALAAFRSSPERGGGPPKAVEGSNKDYLLTAPGDLVLTRGQSRPAQLRRSPAGRLTEAGIAAFLAKLAATANVRLAARSVGVAASSIYRRRDVDGQFAEAMREALSMGYRQVEAALVESACRALDPDPDHEEWLEANGGAPLEPMTFDQAFMLLTLHRRQVRQGWHGFRSEKPGVASDEEVERALKRGLRRFGVKC
jgi:hypothetical protein